MPYWRNLTLSGTHTELQRVARLSSCLGRSDAIFELTKRFPVEEKYSLTDQIRRASRSVCANIGEAWRKRRDRAHFVSKLSDSEGEAEEVRVWLEFSYRCGYMSETAASDLDKEYDRVIAQLVRMIDKPEQWTISKG